MTKQTLEFKKTSSTAKDPEQATENAAGWDLFADKGAIIAGFNKAIIPTGIILKIPKGYYGHIKDRSGNAINTGIHIKAGVVDSDYRGEIKVVVYNDSSYPEKIIAGMKIAQIIFKKYEQFVLKENNDLDIDTERGDTGFGSSDKKDNRKLGSFNKKSK